MSNQRFLRSICRGLEKMIPPIFLLEFVILASAAENGTSDSGVVIDMNERKLLSITAPSTDLDLSGLNLRSLDSIAFANCTSARTIDLSGNWIKKLPKGVFSHLTNLEHLSLANNDLDGETLQGAFLDLANLKSLDISHNPLSRILENDTFVGLPKSCEIVIGRSTNFRVLTPLAFGQTEQLDTKNRTSPNESKDCPDRLSDQIEMFEVERSWILFGKGYEERRRLMYEPYSDVGVKMCTDSSVVRFVDFSNVTDTQSANCSKILINDDGTKLKISDDNVTSFDSGWFRIQNTSLNAIYLYPKGFANLTSDLLNDLPENIRFFSLQQSEVASLHKGVMVNEHLRGLDLSINYISFIDEGAFAGMNLTRLNLGYNPTVNLDYAPTLPESLLWLNLEYNGILEIPAKSFSHLRNLLSLNLAGNSLKELAPPAFDGLVSLQSLDFAISGVTIIRPNVFQSLSRLYYMDLLMNKLARLEKGALNGLGCLAKLRLADNKLTSLDDGAFQGLTDSLEDLDLHANELEVLRTGNFVGAPKSSLLLYENDIRKIETGAFDLPYLSFLDLHENDLRTIEKGAAKNLGNMADKIDILLGQNPIGRLDNGALAGLPSKAYVDLELTPIDVIQVGVFDDPT